MITLEFLFGYYIYKQGKNWYCEIDDIKITINSYRYTIITAHKLKNKNELTNYIEESLL